MTIKAQNIHAWPILETNRCRQNVFLLTVNAQVYLCLEQVGLRFAIAVTAVTVTLSIVVAAIIFVAVVASEQFTCMLSHSQVYKEQISTCQLASTHREESTLSEFLLPREPIRASSTVGPLVGPRAGCQLPQAVKHALTSVPACNNISLRADPRQKPTCILWLSPHISSCLPQCHAQPILFDNSWKQAIMKMHTCLCMQISAVQLGKCT